MIYQTNDPSIFEYPKPVFTRAPAPYVLETDGTGKVQMFYVREVGGRFYKIEVDGALTPVDHSKPVVVYATDGSLFTPSHPGYEFVNGGGGRARSPKRRSRGGRRSRSKKR